MEHDPVVLFERAATAASALAGTVTPAQLGDPTPCRDWTVAQLLAHMAGGTSYLLGALGVDHEAPGTDVGAYRAAVSRYVEALHQPGALEGRCISPAGFEWSIAEATAGPFMDQLVHTWDLAVATGHDRTLDPELAEACVSMFLPAMPEIGREAGLVGPAVVVPIDASAQDRLLGAMGRQP
ncbi:MAG: TIGR03086 family metal-binding protein [Acidimicrobiales bacterium]